MYKQKTNKIHYTDGRLDHKFPVEGERRKEGRKGKREGENEKHRERVNKKKRERERGG